MIELNFEYFFRFSRKARASVAMATIYISIIVSALFYNAREPIEINQYFVFSLLRIDPIDVRVLFFYGSFSYFSFS